MAHNAQLFGADTAAAVAGHEDEVNAYTLAWLAELTAFSQSTAASGPDAAFFRGREVEAEICARIDRVLTEHDLLLCPAMAVPAVDAGVDHTQQPFRLGDADTDPFFDLWLTEPFNIASRCPVLTVPGGRSPDTGVPIGVQLVAGGYDDATAFRAGLALELAKPWPLVADPA
jgi:aspartyl-tRNA(Asn)/glutamyl-tRNA(Gln) amidotransferase subunit A